MNITNIRGLLIVGLAAVFLAGCQSSSDKDSGSDPVSQAPEASTQPAPAPQPERVVPKPNVNNGILFFPEDDQTGSEALQGKFYFDFDQAIVKRDGHMELNKHAVFLRENPSARVRIEGHADERGTREYNLALGERRANAVRAYLMAQGASSSQMEVISYGEERPATDGHNERAWGMNRRVELKYR